MFVKSLFRHYCPDQSVLARVLVAAGTLLMLSFPTVSTSSAQTLSFAVQPVLSESKTRAAYAPLVQYLEQEAGIKISIKTMPNFMAYWDRVRRKESYDMVLDAAHFTDYRASKYGYKVVAKIPDSVSYSLVVKMDNFVFEPTELTGKRIATLGTPSIGAARLSTMFPNPVRQPIVVEVASAEEGFKMLREDRVHAAILPTPLVSREMAQGADINVVLTTEAVPHIAVSVTPSMDPAVATRIQKALIKADQTEQGKAMLQKIGFPKFDAASNGLYSGQANILQKFWGF